MTGARPVSPAVSAGEFARTYEACKNWGRWGLDDEKGALNLITPERVAAAARLVRSGRAAVAKAGLHTSVMPLLHERGVAAIGWDGDGETVPSQCEGVAYPIHAIGICAMGLYYADSLSFEDLATACEEERRWDFFCVIAPLRIEKGTGSPVNPIAIF
jgi:kynurenine formamidase